MVKRKIHSRCGYFTSLNSRLEKYKALKGTFDEDLDRWVKYQKHKYKTNMSIITGEFEKEKSLNSKNKDTAIVFCFNSSCNMNPAYDDWVMRDFIEKNKEFTFVVTTIKTTYKDDKGDYEEYPVTEYIQIVAKKLIQPI